MEAIEEIGGRKRVGRATGDLVTFCGGAEVWERLGLGGVHGQRGGTWVAEKGRIPESYGAWP
jgi:hypothetical protein